MKKIKEADDTINPKCLQDRAISYSVTGHILPCCWVNTSWDQPYLKDLFLDKNHIDNFETLDEIFETSAWINFFDMLKNNPQDAPKKCKQMCNVLLDVNLEGTDTVTDYSHDN